VNVRQGSLTNNIPQVGIIGQTLRFDPPASQTLTVRWSIIGCGKYALGGTFRSPRSYTLPNTAVDVYLNKWVRLFLYLGVTQRNTSASDPAFSYDPTNFLVRVQLESSGHGRPP